MNTEHTDNSGLRELTEEEKQEIIKKGRTTLLQEISLNTKSLARDLHVILILLYGGLCSWFGVELNSGETILETAMNSFPAFILCVLCGLLKYRYEKEINIEQLRAIQENRQPDEIRAIRHAATRFRD